MTKTKKIILLALSCVMLLGGTLTAHSVSVCFKNYYGRQCGAALGNSGILVGPCLKDGCRSSLVLYRCDNTMTTHNIPYCQFHGFQ